MLRLPIYHASFDRTCSDRWGFLHTCVLVCFNRQLCSLDLSDIAITADETSQTFLKIDSSVGLISIYACADSFHTLTVLQHTPIINQISHNLTDVYVCGWVLL